VLLFDLSSPFLFFRVDIFEDEEQKKADDAKPTLCSSRKKGKITDFFPQRRSQRKTREAINAERHQKLIKAILEGTQDGLKVSRGGFIAWIFE